MKTDYATMTIKRNGSGFYRTRSATLKRYNKNGTLIAIKEGRSAYLSATALRNKGIPVVLM